MLFRLRQRLSREKHAAAKEPNSFKALTADPLLKPFQREVSAIRRQAGVPPAYWEKLYDPVIRHYARLVQRLPASESDHHATVGGLLQYGIETARHTLDLKQGVMLPPGAPPEEQARAQDLWTYACFTAALLHNLGKPAIEQRIALHSNAGSRTWTLLSGPMPEGAHYRIGFNDCREQQQHQRISLLLTQYILPSEGLEWLARNTGVLLAWLAAIESEPRAAGAIGEIIYQARLASTQNFSASDARRLDPDFERRRVKFSLKPTQ